MPGKSCFFSQSEQHVFSCIRVAVLSVMPRVSFGELDFRLTVNCVLGTPIVGGRSRLAHVEIFSVRIGKGAEQ